MSASNRIPEQRRREILELLRHEPVQSYRQLTDQLGVSHMTVRRDSAVLADMGRVRLTQGGVAAVHSMGVEPARSTKALVNTPAKAAIAKAAAEVVEDSMVIYLDAGTTVQSLGPLLQDRKDLTVVTNDLNTATSLLEQPNVDLLVIGGRVDKANHSTLGRLAAMTMSELSLDIAFISCSSWDVKHGLTTPVEAKIDLKRTAIAAASTSILLADSAKYGSFAKHRVAHIRELDLVITDDGLESDDAEKLLAAGPELVRVAPHLPE